MKPLISKMKWQNLYSLSRLNGRLKPSTDLLQLRTSFIRDYDRLIFSSGFRRLQNKTQVFPLPGAIFVHNRLTHSLEVASVGRSLGQQIGHLIAEKHSTESEAFQLFYRYELPTVIASACLAHDIGNPPFGHSGEDAIRAYFEDLKGDVAKVFKEELSYNQQCDFTRFEGNSNAFRILTHHFGENHSSYNITMTTLAALVKYPASSAEGFDKSSGLISKKKSGFFDSEIAKYTNIAYHLQIPQLQAYQNVFARHPFVFLTEAADDICYRIIDMEDAHRLGIVSLNTIQQFFLPFFDEEKDFFSINHIKNKMNEMKDANQKTQYLRAVWIGLMTQKMADLFMQYENKLLSGTLQQSLIELLPDNQKKMIRDIDNYSMNHIYNHKPVAEIEITGFHVIGKLLDEFLPAVINPHKAKSKKVLKLLSSQFPINYSAGNTYGNIQSVVDFIAGMTDLYALDLFRKMTGIQITKL